MFYFHFFHSIKIPQPKKRKSALQVQDRSSRFPLSFGRATPKARGLSGSLTLEASLALPLFLFAMYLLILPMRMMDTALRMQQVCEAVCRDAAEGTYLLSLTEKESASDGEAAEQTENAKEIEGYLKGNALGLAAAALAEKEINDGYITNLLSWRSTFLSDGETITLKLDYDYRLPFSCLGLGSIHQTVTASRRAWIGEIKSGLSSGSSSESEEDEEDEIVYVGKNSTRYHKSLSCHYLSNKLTAVSYASVAAEPNSGGSRYQPCARCAKHASGGTVYIMPSGSAYHTDPECSAIRAYGQAVKKSEVAHLGACSYCYPGGDSS